MDATKPYLKHVYYTLYIDYTFEDYTLSPGNRLKYTINGTLSMQRDLNTLIPRYGSTNSMGLKWSNA